MRPWACWSSGWHHHLQQGGWNWMIHEVPLNSNHSMSLWSNSNILALTTVKRKNPPQTVLSSYSILVNNHIRPSVSNANEMEKWRAFSWLRIFIEFHKTCTEISPTAFRSLTAAQTLSQSKSCWIKFEAV